MPDLPPPASSGFPSAPKKQGLVRRLASKVKFRIAEDFSPECPACNGFDLPQAGIRGCALKIGLSQEPKFWDRMCMKQTSTTNTEERDQLLIALMGHRDREAVETWVSRAIGGELSNQEWPTMFIGLSQNSHHAGMAWEALKKHWDIVYKAWGQSQFKMKAIVSYALTDVDLEEAKAFFVDHPCDVARLTIQQTLEGLVVDAALRKRASEVNSYLGTSRSWTSAESCDAAARKATRSASSVLTSALAY